jgi:transglutaminase-like putative cysteine protease
MGNIKFFSLILISIILSNCSQQREKHFISDRAYRNRVHKAFEEKKTLFADTSLFAVFNGVLTGAEREALEFLYAYMPVGDIADYEGDYYLANIRSSFQTRREMPWGDSIPEEIFRHFVLPVRVNNENLDESRMVFYDELKERVKGLSMQDAILEVNHWCHEKVVYQPSDSRTSSPMTSVKTAFGRCGEESTFTVAALRSVGIPARQVYTPRWAHTDDNHAWVEAWMNGKWRFMGACEPEPVLDLGWFNAPASRGLLMHTNVFGYYAGREEIMRRTACFTEINVIENYAPAAKATVKVTDAEGNAVDSALVEFKIYNYAEFYSAAKKYTDRDGKCFLSAGKGDMLVWATKNAKFGYGKISFGKDKNITVVLDRTQDSNCGETVDTDVTPPSESAPAVKVTEEERAENKRRLAREDSLRNAYTATFFTGETAGKYGDGASYVIKSCGNHAEIEKFLNGVPDSLRPRALALLRVISGKDLRDISADKLFDHLNNVRTVEAKLLNGDEPEENLFDACVLNPRVSNEYHSSYRKFFREKIDENLRDKVINNPQLAVEWVKKNIAVRDDLNPQYIPVTPRGVFRARIADRHSRNIFFVAAARSMGIPARIERVTGKVQYYSQGWHDVDFDSEEKQSATKKGLLSVSYRPVKTAENPKYYTHFSIAKIQPDATLRTLNFENHAGGDTWKALFGKPLELDGGSYMLVSGTRMASGKVLARLKFFTVEPDRTTDIDLVLREGTDDIQVLGNIDAEAKFANAANGEETSILNATGRGYFIVGILDPRQEPTIHAMNDIVKMKADFEKWNRSVILLFKDEADCKLFNKNDFGALPSTVVRGIDREGKITEMISAAMKLEDKSRLPIFIIADTFGRVVFVSQGYTIGLGEQMIKTINKI